MKRICIGVSVHAEPERLRATLKYLREYTSMAFDLLLLPDGPDEATKALLNTLRDVPQSATTEPLGTPSCFNRLATSTDTDIVILLESGVLVGPQWLEYLLAALAANPHNGLAGPSTNRSWNEQGIFPRASGAPTDVAHTAKMVQARFGKKNRTLEPLYSLADFCYLVRREVIDALGLADESYGLGPCWEMDYNIRAARKGFHGVWACGSYVYRAPFTARRQAEEKLRFERSKQLYQDRFCGLRLRGEKSTYETHCRGEACEHFAPQALIRITLPLQKAACPSSDEINTPDTNLPTKKESVGAAQEIRQKTNDFPLVSCIMPTHNRRDFIAQALAYFARQDYPNRELIILDDGNDRVEDLIPPDPRIRYLALSKQLSIGAKRNMACEMAHGAIIAHWDDDDWYASHRLNYQIIPLISDQADITGLETSCFFDLNNWQAWTCSPMLHRRLFVGDVHGSTLVYWRRVWEKQAHYPAISLAEDARFLQQANRTGARLLKLPHAHSFVYLRHGKNAWRFPVGSYLQPADWQQVELDTFLPPADQPFYEKLAPPQTLMSLEPLVSAAYLVQSESPPLVSCIMPTHNRRCFVAQAIAYFLRQDYPNKELIILDDGIDAVEDLIPTDKCITYLRLSQRLTVEAKRNMACEQAKGSIIAHWDDDDWHAPQRLSYQVEALLRQNVDFCGINKPLFYDPTNRRAWQYLYSAGPKIWLSGSTLCYKRDFWASNRFANLNVGEDARFVWSSQHGRVTVLKDTNFHMGIIHKENVSPKRTLGPYWRAYQVQAIQSLLGADWDFYHSLQVSSFRFDGSSAY